MTASKRSIAYLCDRLGPYHIARLDAVSRVMDVAAIEMSRKDTTYDWAHADSGSSFRRTTLFEDRPWNSYPRREVARRVTEALDAVCPDVVAIPGWESPAALTALAWCLKWGAPSVLLADSQYHDMPRQWWKEAIKARIVSLHNSAFVGGETHVDYLERLGMGRDKVMLGYNVTDTGYFSRSTDAIRETDAVIRAKLALPQRYFLASCRFVEKKNLDRLLRAYAACCSGLDQSAWGLVLVGDGPLKTELQQLASELGVQHKVIFTGFKQYQELPAYYALASAFVLPSIEEQWGLVVNEAMACGLPVLVSSVCGCARALVKEGVNGFTFDPLDENGLATLLKRINTGTWDLEKMGQASRDIIAAYTPEAFAEKLALVAEQAAVTPRRPHTFFDRILLHFLVRR